VLVGAEVTSGILGFTVDSIAPPPTLVEWRRALRSHGSVLVAAMSLATCFLRGTVVQPQYDHNHWVAASDVDFRFGPAGNSGAFRCGRPSCASETDAVVVAASLPNGTTEETKAPRDLRTE